MVPPGPGFKTRSPSRKNRPSASTRDGASRPNFKAWRSKPPRGGNHPFRDGLKWCLSTPTSRPRRSDLLGGDRSPWMPKVVPRAASFKPVGAASKGRSAPRRKPEMMPWGDPFKRVGDTAPKGDVRPAVARLRRPPPPAPRPRSGAPRCVRRPLGSRPVSAGPPLQDVSGVG